MSTHAIESLDDERLDAYARLTEAQLRNKLEPEKGIFIAESFKVIDRALEAGYEPVSLLVTPRWLKEAEECAVVAEGNFGAEVPVFVAPMEVLRDLTGFNLTRGALAAMRRPPYPPLKQVLSGARRIAVLDGIVDHTNVGAIFRSAAALDVDAVLTTPTCCDPLYRRAARVSMGTVFQVPWTRIGQSVADWPGPGIELLHEAGFTVAAFALKDDSLSLADPRLHDYDKLAMVFGTEGDGLSREAIEGCDITVKIPMSHGVDSLNVAAASAVAFWELCKHSC
ncbi:MAG: RNA methyltransferase [Coriobacteriia bacterium]|nr:RNA methyltransferase [Coriobacteriia bacterium]